MELEGQWWKGQLAADIHQALRNKVSGASLGAAAKLFKTEHPGNVVMYRIFKLFTVHWKKVVYFHVLDFTFVHFLFKKTTMS